MPQAILKAIYSPPEFADEEKRRIMRLLNIVQWVSLSILIMAMVLTLLNHTFASFWFLLVGVVILIATIWLARAGHPHLASLVLLVALVFVTLGLMAAGNGVHDITIMILPSIVILASLLLQRRVFIVFCLFLAAATNVFVVAEMNGLVNNPYGPMVDISDALYLNLMLATAAFGMGVVSNSLLHNLRRARQSEQDLAATNIDLVRRDSILRSTAFAAEKFLSAPDWHANICAVLEELGSQAGASSAYVFEIHSLPDGTTAMSLKYEWASYPDALAGDNPVFQNIPLDKDVPDFYIGALLRNEPVTACLSDLSGADRRLMEQWKIASFVEVPVMVGGVLWGSIGMDDEQIERRWSLAEIDALRVTANVLSAAIQRQNTDKALRERDELYRRAIAAADAVPYYRDYALDRFVYIGSGITRLLGYSPAEVTPQLLNQLSVTVEMHGEHAGRSMEEAHKLVRAGQSVEWRCDHLSKTKSGEERWYTDSAVQVWSDDGQLVGSIGILFDITERKQAEAAVRALNIDLEHRVRDRTAELELTLAELEAFTYSVSHDLRAPLRAVRGYSRLLQEDYQAALDEDGRLYLDNLGRAAGRMEQLIEDLLNLSRISSWEMRRLPVNLSHLAEAALTEFQQGSPDRVVTVAIQPGVMAEGDPNLLRILMENLLENAWKFTGKVPQASIEFAVAQQAAPTVYVVRDNGAGFDMAFADRLFSPFERLHHQDDFEGTGIGLATVKRIVRRHGGKIWAEAVAGRGAAFFFTLAEG